MDASKEAVSMGRRPKGKGWTYLWDRHFWRGENGRRRSKALRQLKRVSRRQLRLLAVEEEE